MQFATEPLNLIQSIALTNENSKVISPLPSLYEEVMATEELEMTTLSSKSSY